MNREAIEVGAFTWSRVQRLYDAVAAAHWQRCAAEGLECPQEVFTQLFHAEEVQSMPAESADVRPGLPRLLDLGSVRAIDWGRVKWELQEMSGIALRHVRINREYQHALDEARDQATRFGIADDREDIVAHWKEAQSWVTAPVLVAADLLGGGAGYELLVGFTRLGNLLGMLDRQEVQEIKKHLVWVGRLSKLEER